MKIKGSIRRRLVISLVLLAIIPLLLLGTLLSWQSFVIQQRQIIELQREKALRVLNQIGSIIHKQEELLSNALTIDYYILDIGSEKQGRFLSQMLSFSDESRVSIFNEIALLDSRGQELARESRTSIITPKDLRNRSNAEEFTVPLSKRQTYYGPVYIDDKTGAPFMLMSIPVIDTRNDIVKGVLTAEMRMKFMWDIVDRINVGESGVVYVVDRTGRVIVHPNPSVVLKGEHFDIENKSGISTGLDGSKAVLTNDILSLGTQRLHVMTEIPLVTALKSTYTSLLTIAVFLVLTLTGSVVLGFITVRQIIRPVESLAETALAISSGDIDRKAVVIRNDELGALSESFNIMTSRLAETITSLKNQITEREKAERALSESLREKEVLLKEIHHRVKNNMQVISSLLNLQARQISDKQYIELFNESRNRIASMALVHEKLYNSKDLTNIDFKDYINCLANELFSFYGISPKKILLKISSENIRLPIDTAIPCGLIINELVSNSLKYAFPEGKNGEINIILDKTSADDNDNFYNLTVSDNGIGIPGDLDIRRLKSLGLQLVITLVEHQLKGGMQLDRSKGTLFDIHFKELKYKSRI
ncbi:MAG: HAMP domain-containing protein [Nitrospirae bacterium]|nr:HAMP domain-containing protein [Nitrospirota bacterium]